MLKIGTLFLDTPLSFATFSPVYLRKLDAYWSLGKPQSISDVFIEHVVHSGLVNTCYLNHFSSQLCQENNLLNI